MAEYPPPIKDVPIFNNYYYGNNQEALNIANASKYFVRYPDAQGTVNLADTNIGGLTNMYGNLSLKNTATITYPNNSVQSSAYTGYANHAGTYTNTNLTIDADGKITSLSNGTGSATTITKLYYDIYVSKQTGNDTTGTGQQNAPFATVQAAINYCENPSGLTAYLASLGITIQSGYIRLIVEAGNYPESITINSNLTITGAKPLNNDWFNYYTFYNMTQIQNVNITNTNSSTISVFLNELYFSGQLTITGSNGAMNIMLSKLAFDCPSRTETNNQPVLNVINNSSALITLQSTDCLLSKTLTAGNANAPIIDTTQGSSKAVICDFYRTRVNGRYDGTDAWFKFGRSFYFTDCQLNITSNNTSVNCPIIRWYSNITSETSTLNYTEFNCPNTTSKGASYNLITNDATATSASFLKLAFNTIYDGNLVSGTNYIFNNLSTTKNIGIYDYNNMFNINLNGNYYNGLYTMTVNANYTSDVNIGGNNITNATTISSTNGNITNVNTSLITFADSTTLTTAPRTTIVNVLNYGAVMNNTASASANSTALQNAINYCMSNSGLTLFIPEGTLYLSGTTTITVDGDLSGATNPSFKIVGNNMENTQLYWLSPSNINLFYIKYNNYGGTVRLFQYLEINNISFVCNNTLGNLLTLNGCSFTSLRRVLFLNSFNSITLYNCITVDYNAVFCRFVNGTGMTIHGAYNDGIWTGTNGNNHNLINCSITGLVCGLYCYDAGSVNIIGSDFENCGGTIGSASNGAIIFTNNSTNANGLTVANCYIEGNIGLADIQIVSTYYSTHYIANNEFHRLGTTQFSTNNIYINSTVSSVFNIEGNAFKYFSYTPSASRPNIAINGASSKVNYYGNIYQSSIEAPSYTDTININQVLNNQQQVLTVNTSQVVDFKQQPTLNGANLGAFGIPTSYTPVIRDNTTPCIGTYSSQIGTYLSLGNNYYLIYVNVAASAYPSSSSLNLNISLPFSLSSSANIQPLTLAFWNGINGYADINPFVMPSNDGIGFYGCNKNLTGDGQVIINTSYASTTSYLKFIISGIIKIT